MSGPEETRPEETRPEDTRPEPHTPDAKTTLSGRLVLHFDSPQQAAAAAAALAPEDGPHAVTRQEGATVVVEVHEAGIGSAAMTIDDILACLGAVQRADAATR